MVRNRLLRAAGAAGSRDEDGTETWVARCDSEIVPAQAPRIDPRLRAAVTHLDRPDRPLADTHRRLGEVADALGLPRPSYEQVRTLIHASRQRADVRRKARHDALDLVLDVEFGRRSPLALLDLVELG
jgi:hypothetical protein